MQNKFSSLLKMKNKTIKNTLLEISGFDKTDKTEGKKHEQRKSLRAFTLIEMLVSIAIFSILIGAVSGIFISGIRQQRITLITQTLLDQTSYALEYMSRALRMARKELSTPAICLTTQGRGFNYEVHDGGMRIRFINTLERNDCQEFFLEGGRLKYRKKIGLAEETFYLTSHKLKIDSLIFNLVGASQEDDLQPRVTISLKIGVRKTPEIFPKVKIQTAISQRTLDIRR